MKCAPYPRGLRGLFVFAMIAALAVGFLFMTRVATPSFPTTTLTLLRLTNLPPIGIMTAFAVSNGSPHRLLYDPRMVKYLTSTGWVVVPPGAIVDRVGVVSPGQTYVFLVPGVVTNHSLRVQVVSRRKTELQRVFTKVDQFAQRASKTEAWFGRRYEAILEPSH